MIVAAKLSAAYPPTVPRPALNGVDSGIIGRPDGGDIHALVVMGIDPALLV